MSLVTCPDCDKIFVSNLKHYCTAINKVRDIKVVIETRKEDNDKSVLQRERF